MSKDTWITLALDGTVPAEEIKMLLVRSSDFIEVKIKWHKISTDE